MGNLNNEQFQEIKAAAFENIQALLQEWFPEGKIISGDYCVGGYDGHPGESLKIDLAKGIGTDFAEHGKKGGDLIAINQHRLGCTPAASALDIAAKLREWGVRLEGVPTANGASPHKLKRQIVSPVPEEHALIDVALEHFCIRQNQALRKKKPSEEIPTRTIYPDPVEAETAFARRETMPSYTTFEIKLWPYRNAAGELLHYVARWDTPAGKQIRPITWDGNDWEFGNYHTPHPLYGLPQLASHPGAPVLVVEGEKTADAAATLFPDYVAVTWMGGDKRVKSADWSPLKGRTVKLVPDADEAGKKAMAEVARQALLSGATVVETVSLPDNLPEGWDLADPTTINLSTLLANTTGASSSTDFSADVYGPELAGALCELNKKHFVVQESGRTWVYTERFDDEMKRWELDASTFTDIRNLYLNRKFVVGEDRSGKRRINSLGAIWLEAPEHRQYERITLSPQGTSRDTYNLWKGFSVEPRPGDWSLLKEHVLTNVCREDFRLFDYLFGWAATLIQRPADTGEVALVLRGKKGTGKGVFLRALGHLLPQHFLQIFNHKHLSGQFNGHLRDVILLFADEAFWAGDKQGESVLKGLITEPRIPIERKGKDVISVRNMVHLVMSSNADWVIPASLDERRFCVLDVGEKHMRDLPYFAAIDDQLKNGGHAALLHDLLGFNLDTFEVRRIPQTAALREQQIRSLSPDEAWWYEKLQSGRLIESQEHWDHWVESEALFNDYYARLGRTGVSRKSNETGVGMFFRKMLAPIAGKWPQKTEVPRPDDSEDILTDKHGNTITKKRRSKTMTVYRFPPLQDCRLAFAKIGGHQVEFEMDWDQEALSRPDPLEGVPF